MPSTPLLSYSVVVRRASVVAVVVFLVCQSASASVWNSSTGGNWSDAGKWTGGIPDAVDAVADFSQQNLTANQAVTVDTTSRTVGSLLFGDADTGTPFNWTVSSNRLILQKSSGVPDINVVNQTTTISSALSGTQGFAKTGNGKLALNSTGPVLTGGITVTTGELASNSSLTNVFGNNALTVGSGATLRVSSHTGSTTVLTREISGAGVLATNVTSGSPNTTIRPYALNDTTFSGSAEGTSKFILDTAGPRTWTLTGSFASSLTSAAINNGGLVLAGTAAFDRNDSSNFSSANAGTFGTLTLDNTGTNNTDRYRDASSITLAGGQLRLLGNGGAATSETMNGMTSSASTVSAIDLVRNGQNVTLAFAGNWNASGAVNIATSGGTLGGNIKVTVAGTNVLDNNIVRRTFVNGIDFAAVDGANGIVAYTAYNTDANINTASATAAFLVNGSTSNTILSGANKTLGALKIDGPRTINVADKILTVGTSNANTAGLLLKTGTGTAVITGSTGGQLTVGSLTPNYEVRVNDGQLTISTEINLPNTNRFVKSGPGVLDITSATLANATSADTIVVAEGVVRMNPNAVGLSGPLRVLAGDIMEITGISSYSPVIGTGTDNVSFTNGGGFAAFGGNVDVTTSITWGASSTVNDGKPLLLNSTTADSVIQLSGSLNLSGANTALQFRELRVADNASSSSDKAVISGQITATTSGGGTPVNQSHLLKTGGGLLELTHVNNTYSGETIVREGRLNVNGTLSALTAPDHGAVTAMSGGTLGGTGVINRPVVAEAGSFLSPGTSPGGLEIGSTLQLLAGSTFQIELGGTSFTLNGLEQYDRVKVTGATTIAGLLDVSLVNSFALGANQFFGIIDAVGGLSGTFTGLIQDATVLTNSGYDLKISYTGLIGDSGTPSITGGNDIILYTSSVPEPGTLAMLLCGAWVLWLVRKR